MNPAVCLLCLPQGNQAIEDYVNEFCGLCDKVDFNDAALKGLFLNGIEIFLLVNFELSNAWQ